MSSAYKGVGRVSSIALAILVVVSPAHAQLSGIKKLGSKIKDATVGGVNGVAAGATGKSSTDQPKTTGFADQSTAYSRLKDGEPAAIPTTLSEADATAKTKAYLNSRDIDFTINQDTGRIISDWYGEHRCGVGFNRCANRAMIRVTSEGGQTAVRVQVFERKREAGINEKPWKENSTSRGKETGEFATALLAFLSTVAPPQ